MKGTQYFYNKIRAALNGENGERDFDGMTAVITLYRRSTDDEKRSFLKAIEKILSEKTSDKGVLADLLDVAIALRIEEIKKTVEALKSKPCYGDQMVRIAVNNYLACLENGYFKRDEFYKKPWETCNP